MFKVPPNALINIGSGAHLVLLVPLAIQLSRDHHFHLRVSTSTQPHVFIVGEYTVAR